MISRWMGDLRSMTFLVLWVIGLVVALMTGNMSMYLIISALYFGSRAEARRKALQEAEESQIDSGGPA